MSSQNVDLMVYWLDFLKNNGTTLVLVEHRIKELFSLVDKIIGLKLGTLTMGKLNNLETIKRFLV